MAYQFTDKDNMVGKRVRQTYFTEIQDAINDSADKIGILFGNMPQQIVDEDTGRVYRVGRRFKDGGMQKIWEEVV